MRGRTNNLTIGERVAWYRYRRGLSQEVLAGLIGRTADWLGKVENNRIELDRLSVIKSLAEVLDVPLGDLLGEPALLDWTSDSGTATVPALRAALMNYHALGPFSAGPDQEPPSVAALKKDVGALWDAYQNSRFGYVTGRLPDLLHRAQAAADHHDGDDQDHARRLLGLTYQLAATQLTKLGESDLAWIAADRGLGAVRPTGDPLITGSLFRSVGHALHATGRYAEAVRLTEDAAGYLEPHLTQATPELLSVYGTLFLSGSMAAARANDAATTRAFLAAADHAASQLGADANQPPVDRFRPDQRRHPPRSHRRRAGRPASRHRPRPACRHHRSTHGAPGTPRPRSRPRLQLLEPLRRRPSRATRRRTDGTRTGPPPLPQPPTRPHLDTPPARQAHRRTGRTGPATQGARLTATPSTLPR